MPADFQTIRRKPATLRHAAASSAADVKPRGSYQFCGGKKPAETPLGDLAELPYLRHSCRVCFGCGPTRVRQPLKSASARADF